MTFNFRKLFTIRNASPARKIALSFILVILTGTILLMLPISNQDGEFFAPLDALFTATSATCVTGLTLVTLMDQFTRFGQCVILTLIQIGGLGLMTFMAIFIMLVKHRLTLHDKIAVKSMLNQDHVFNMRKFIFDIVKYTLCFEIIGMIILCFRFVPLYGAEGIFHSLFLAVSAFCNAGFDTLGPISLQAYVHDPLVCITIMSLIVMGGLGFAVWFDVRDKVKPLLKREINFRKFRKSLALHTKIVLIVTASLIVFTAAIIGFMEYNNTMQGFSAPQVVMSSLFESISLRTAGFTSIDYTGLNTASQLTMMVAMFIGGSPGGTAGGIKTTTIAVLVIYMVGMFKGREHTQVFQRTLKKEIVVRAMAIFFINLVALFTGILLLCMFTDLSFNALCFEAVSAMATVGSSLGITTSLNEVGKIVIIMLMYVGRIGIITLVFSLWRSRKNHSANEVTFPEGNVIVG